MATEFIEQGRHRGLGSRWQRLVAWMEAQLVLVREVGGWVARGEGKANSLGMNIG